MGALREKMIEEMKLSNFAPRTQKSYVAAVVRRVRRVGPARRIDLVTKDCKIGVAQALSGAFLKVKRTL